MTSPQDTQPPPPRHQPPHPPAEFDRMPLDLNAPRHVIYTGPAPPMHPARGLASVGMVFMCIATVLAAMGAVGAAAVGFGWAFGLIVFAIAWNQ